MLTFKSIDIASRWCLPNCAKYWPVSSPISNQTPPFPFICSTPRVEVKCLVSGPHNYQAKGNLHSADSGIVHRYSDTGIFQMHMGLKQYSMTSFFHLYITSSGWVFSSIDAPQMGTILSAVPVGLAGAKVQQASAGVRPRHPRRIRRRWGIVLALWSAAIVVISGGRSVTQPGPPGSPAAPNCHRS